MSLMVDVRGIVFCHFTKWFSGHARHCLPRSNAQKRGGPRPHGRKNPARLRGGVGVTTMRENEDKWAA